MGHHRSRTYFWVGMVVQENQWFYHTWRCGHSKTIGLWLMFQVLIGGQMTDKPNMKEPTMDCTWFTNMLWNGWISLGLVMNICWLKSRSSLNCMVNSISQVLIKRSMSQFLICGMREGRFILMKSKKFSSTEWMRPLSLKKKNKQLSESQTYSKLQKISSIS